MSITIDELKKMAKMSRIHVDEDKMLNLCKDINDMFVFIEQIRTVDTDGVEPLVSPIEINLQMRDDIVNDGNNVKAVMENAPLSQENFFLVPKVVE